MHRKFGIIHKLMNIYVFRNMWDMTIMVRETRKNLQFYREARLIAATEVNENFPFLLTSMFS